MKAQLKSLFFSIAVIMATAPAALAGGDYYNVGDYVGVPVPAPAPIPLYDPVWYFRFDTALVLNEAPGASESGMVVGGGGGALSAANPAPTNGSWLDSSYKQAFTFAAGVGYRWSNNIRIDVTGETLPDHKVRINGSRTANLAGGGGRLRSTVYDRATVRGGAIMFNAYYDFSNYYGFRPYIGGGLGIGIREINRETDVTDQVVGGGGRISTSEQLRHHDASFAFAVMLGTTYQITDITDLDFSYRYLWMEGARSGIGFRGETSRIEIDDTNDHQLRAGLRFNVN